MYKIFIFKGEVSMENIEFNKVALISTMIIYIIIMIGFIIYLTLTREQKTLEDYTLGGRNLGWLASSLSAMASQSSGFMFIGFVGIGYLLGGFAAWYVLTDCLNVVLLWTFFAWRLKHFSDYYKAIDLPDLLSSLYNDKNNVLRTVASLAVCIFMMGYVSSQITAASKTIGPVLDISFEWGVIIAAVAILAYTVFAGYTGIAWTDTIQGFIMMFAAFVTPIVAVIYIGGWETLATTLAKADPILITARGAKPLIIASAIIIGWVSVSFSCWGQPHVVTRIMALRNVTLMKKAALMSTFFFAFTRASALIIGLSARAILPELPDPEWAFPMLIGKIFNPYVAGIMICAVIASIVTTADSQLLAASTALVRNIYQRVLKRDLEVSEQKLVLYTKILTVAIAIICTALAIYAKGIVFWMVLFAYVGSGAALGIPLVVRLYWKRANKYGGIAGVIVGLLTVIIWKTMGLNKAIIHEGVPGLIFALLAVVIVSLLTEEDKFIKEQHEKVLKY